MAAMRSHESSSKRFDCPVVSLTIDVTPPGVHRRSPIPVTVEPSPDEGSTAVIGRVKVEMRRSGGFTGRTTDVRLDTAHMPPAEAARLAQLVATVDLSRLPGPRRSPAAGADLMRYDLVIDNGADRWEGTVADPSIPNELRPLLQFLTAAARPA
jgi:hypothetical protein